MYTVFLAGGIGAGKSTVSELLRVKGAQVVSLDLIGHEVLREPQVKLELARRFGEDVLEWPEGFEAGWIASGAGLVMCADDCACDDSVIASFAPGRASTLVEAEDPLDFACQGTVDLAVVNRAVLAERAFSCETETRALNAITHPRILARLGEIVAGPCCMNAGAKVCVVEVPLIEDVQEALVLADEIATVACPVDLRRERAVARGMTAEAFDERNARQTTDEERAALAQTVFHNDGDRAALEAQVEAWWNTRAARGWRCPVSSPAQVPLVE